MSRADTIAVTIPGEPCAQGRPRAAVVKGRAIVYDPSASRSWKGAARYQMQAELDGRDLIADGPVSVVIRAFHPCPKSDYRKRTPAPLRWRAKRPDAENVAKACLDAATGVLWMDDAQVARLVVEQFTAAQGEAPRVEMEVRDLDEIVATGGEE